ncbi:MAG: hypothetical protein ACOCQC_03365 [Halanaerobiaceae bacterium]
MQMHKRKKKKADGRNIIYYEFVEQPPGQVENGEVSAGGTSTDEPQDLAESQKNREQGADSDV